MLTANEAFALLEARRRTELEPCRALYTGEARLLRLTGEPGSFWRRPGKQKVHVPLAAELCQTAASLLFGEEPRVTAVDALEAPLPEAQRKLEGMLRASRFHGLLCALAEGCAAYGDAYLKLAWGDGPVRLLPVPAEAAWPEYAGGRLAALHFFTYAGHEGSRVLRVWEAYSPGMVRTMVYAGSEEALGAPRPHALGPMGLKERLRVPGGGMAACHIPNLQPCRDAPNAFLGRSDLAGLRPLMDALDEAMTSWMRDVRLGKARLLVPAEYLRRRPEALFGGHAPAFAFDEDAETLVALDMDPEHPSGITGSQFAIRAEEHQRTCEALVRRIAGAAGYAPQTLGLDTQGLAQSGTALRIRERRSLMTAARKQASWQDALEELLTDALWLSAALQGEALPQGAHVHLRFAEPMSDDRSETAALLQRLTQAGAASTETKVRLLHPDWTEDQVRTEAALCRREQGACPCETTDSERREEP